MTRVSQLYARGTVEGTYWCRRYHAIDLHNLIYWSRNELTLAEILEIWASLEPITLPVPLRGNAARRKEKQAL